MHLPEPLTTPILPLSLPIPPSPPLPPPPMPTASVVVAQPPPLAVVERQSSRPMFTFTQGILLGQASMILLAVLFLKHVVFEDPNAAKKERERRKRAAGLTGGASETDGETSGLEDGARRKRDRKGKGKASPLTGDPPPTPAPSAASLLASLSYDLSSHAPESLDWLNILLAQLISSYRSLAANHPGGGARHLVEESLNRRSRFGAAEGDDDGGSRGMIGLDYIEVDEVELGEGFPALTDARVRPSGMGGESVRVELDLEYSDTVVLAVSTRVVMNFPRPRFAVLPVSLSVTLERFSGIVTVELPPLSTPTPSLVPPTTETPPRHAHPTVHLSLHPDFDLVLSTSSLLGSRAKLQDVPKVEQLLKARIRAAIQDKVVWPGRIEIALPGLVRTHHHHHHSSAGTGTGADDSPASPVSPLATHLATPPPDLPSSPSPSSSLPLSNPLLSRLESSDLSSSQSGSTTPDTPSLSLSSNTGNPTVHLHPRVRPQFHKLSSPSLGVEVLGGVGIGATTSPTTESLPGYFPPLPGLGAGGAGLGGKRVSGTAEPGGLGVGGAGMRYRPGTGVRGR
ncbi:mitochondrial outer membrane protein Mmm1 [Rhodotorula toruloides]|uniref:Maintenance of mitochondrial morphology protein 1 n=1 Tax=Rhodotorula toruloides TaxID=5286 RepID=A0A511KPC8_RHOTO|nr:mitochondrial outer membrane protein Mmm1 [Rhodotorula toruloides]